MPEKLYLEELEGYNNFSIATSLKITNNEYTIGFDTYERQFEFDSETLSEISKKQYVGSGYMVLKKHTKGDYKIVKYVGNNFLETEMYKIYEELLSKGKTENGLEITHYAFLNLDSDSIIELLVSNGNGTPDSMSEYELYTIRDGKIHFCARSGSYYKYIYLVNDSKYVLGCSRMGNEFISIDEKIALTSSWNASLSKYQSAISYNDGEWEEITTGEYSYYHIFSEHTDVEGFIKSSEILSLKENILLSQNKDEDYSVYNGHYSGGGVYAGEDVRTGAPDLVAVWNATISNASESSMNLSFEISESMCCVNDVVLNKQEDGSYFGVGEEWWGGQTAISLRLETPTSITVTVDEGNTNNPKTECLYKK